MHESDYTLADYTLTPLPLLYLRCNLDSGETGLMLVPSISLMSANSTQYKGIEWVGA